jgi:hypothetical protein
LKKITNAIRKTHSYTEHDRIEEAKSRKQIKTIKIEYINEHIFGIIKRQWGYNHTNLTGLEKNGELSLIMLVYNIKRSITILGVSDLIAKLKKWNLTLATACFVCITNYFRLSKDSITNQLQFAA